MDERWQEIALQGEAVFQRMMQSGSTTPHAPDLAVLRTSILSFLDDFPITLAQAQGECQDRASADTTAFLAGIERLRIQAELALVICAEFSESCTVGKIRNLTFTWQLRESVT